MLQLCDKMLAFYPKEIAKTEKRLQRFEELKAHWMEKPEAS